MYRSKRNRVFWLQIIRANGDNKSEDSSLKGHSAQGTIENIRKQDEDKMMQALKAAHLSYDIVENLFGCSKAIGYRYNGGYSIYLFIPMSVFESEPTYNLHAKVDIFRRIRRLYSKMVVRYYATRDWVW